MAASHPSQAYDVEHREDEEADARGNQNRIEHVICPRTRRTVPMRQVTPAFRLRRLSYCAMPHIDARLGTTAWEYRRHINLPVSRPSKS